MTEKDREREREREQPERRTDVAAVEERNKREGGGKMKEGDKR